MVLKLLIRYIINKYLKDYIEELDNEKLKLDFGHGNVSLENLRLKPEALVGLGMPVTVAFGFIDKLSIVISWRNLHSHPTKVHLDGLYMLIVPKNEMRRDLTEHHSEKMKKVEKKLEHLRKTTKDEYQVEEKDKGFFERMKFQMLQNLHVTVTNVHVCYETNSTAKLGHPFSFGITIHSIQLITSKNAKKIGRNKENSLVMAELKGIDHLSVYWNSHCQSRIHMSADYIKQDLKSQIASENRKVKSTAMNYILHPVNINIRLELTLKFAERNFERPIVKGVYHIEDLNFEIDSKQLSDLLDFAKFQNYSVFYDRCREYRQLYLQQLANVNLTQQQNDRIHILESKLDVYTLAYIRLTVELDAKQHQHHHDDDDEDYSWWNWWWQGNAKNNQDNHHKHMEAITSKQTFSSRELYSTDMDVRIKSLRMDLVTPLSRFTKIEKICHVGIDHAHLDYKRRAVSSGVLCGVNVAHLEISGVESNEHSHQRPTILTRATYSHHPVIRLEFELAPIEKKSDYRLALILEPVTVIFHAETINRIVHNFQPIEKDAFVATTQKKKRTFEQMKNELPRKQIFDMTIQMHDLSLVLPEYGCYQTDCKLLLVRFDHLLLRSILDKKKDDNDGNLFQRRSNERQFYKKYEFLCHNLTMIYLEPNQPRMDVFRPIPSLNINFYKCFFIDDITLTDWCIALQMHPMGQINTSHLFLKKLIEHHQNIPSYYASMTEALYRFNLLFSIFPPDVTVESDLSIKNWCVNFIDSKQSVQTDFAVCISKTRKDDQFDQYLDFRAKNIIMRANESSKPFYKNDQIQLLYSESDTKL